MSDPVMAEVISRASSYVIRFNADGQEQTANLGATIAALLVERSAALARATAAEAEIAAAVTHAADLTAKLVEARNRATAAEAREAKLREALTRHASRSLRELVEWLQESDEHPLMLLACLSADEIARARAALSDPARPAAEPEG